jgi:hypothetical protein
VPPFDYLAVSLQRMHELTSLPVLVAGQVEA